TAALATGESTAIATPDALVTRAADAHVVALRAGRVAAVLDGRTLELVDGTGAITARWTIPPEIPDGAIDDSLGAIAFTPDGTRAAVSACTTRSCQLVVLDARSGVVAESRSRLIAIDRAPSLGWLDAATLLVAATDQDLAALWRVTVATDGTLAA